MAHILQDPQFTQEYAFTLTVNPQLFKRTVVHQLNCTAKTLNSLFPHAKISTVMELTKNYNVHYHGIIQFHYADLKDKVPESYWHNKLRNHATLGYSVLKPMVDEKGWKEYILKDLPRTEAELDKTYYTAIIQDEHGLQAYAQAMADAQSDEEPTFIWNPKLMT